MKVRYGVIITVLAVMAASVSCRTPLFTLPDTGDVLESGQVELTPGFTSVNYSGDGVSGQETRNFGGQVSFGTGKLPLIGCRTETAVRLEYADHVSSGVEDWFYFRIQSKFHLGGRMSFVWASTMNWRDESFDWNLMDLGLIGSFTVASAVDMSVYAMANFIDRDDGGDNSLGLLPGIGTNLDFQLGAGSVSLRPGAAYLWDSEGAHSRWSWSLFVAFRTGN